MSKSIRLDKSETALWNEVGSRGDHFRAATRDRAVEETRITGHMTQILDASGTMLGAVERQDPVPESESPPLAATAQSGADAQCILHRQGR